jgi:hypothetical protein
MKLGDRSSGCLPPIGNDAVSPQVFVEDDHLRRRLHELNGEEADAADARRRGEETAGRRVVDAAVIEDVLCPGASFRREWDRIGRRRVDADRASRCRHAGFVAGRFGVPVSAPRAGLIDAGLSQGLPSAGLRCRVGILLVCADASEAARTHDITKHAVRISMILI